MQMSAVIKKTLGEYLTHPNVFALRNIQHVKCSNGRNIEKVICTIYIYSTYIGITLCYIHSW